MTQPCTPELFLKDVSTHQLAVLRDEGVYRHLRFAKPGVNDMAFDLITWPGHLCYTGDMGTYTFARLTDMFEFFRRPSDAGWSGMSKRYWEEKCTSCSHEGLREFDDELFSRAVLEYLVGWLRSHRDETTKEERRDLWEAVRDEVLHVGDDSHGTRKQIAVYDFVHSVNSGLRFYFQDFFERTFDRQTFHFVWCCYALAWGIGQYDLLNGKATQVQTHPA